MKKYRTNYPYCPSNDWACPYWEEDKCMMYREEGVPPYEECDDFFEFEEEE